MGNTIHLKNATSETLYVITAPNLDWSIADLCVEAASLAKAVYGLTTLDAIKTLRNLKTLMRFGSVLSGMSALADKISIVVEAANLTNAFKRDATRIEPGQIFAVNHKVTENPMEYMQPSAWAAITKAQDITLVILSESNLMFATFSTNSDDSWIATDKSVVRAKYGALSTPDPDAGEYQWEGNPAMVSGTLDATTWTAEAPIAPEGWVTRHPAALYNAPNEGLCALYVGESGRTHFGRVPPPPNAGVLAERTPAFFEEWRSAEAPALTYTSTWVAAMVRDDGSVHIGRNNGDGNWHTCKLGQWSTREGVALLAYSDFVVAHVGRSPSLYIATISYRVKEGESPHTGAFEIDTLIRLPEEYNTELAPALALHNNDLFFAYVDTSGAAYVAKYRDKPERVRVFRDQTTRKPLGLTSFAGRLYLSFVDHRGKAYVISSENGEEWPTYYDRIFPGHITRLQVPLAVSGEQLLASFTGMPDLDDWSTTARARFCTGDALVIRSQQSDLALTHGGSDMVVKMERFTNAINQLWLIDELTEVAPGYYIIYATPPVPSPDDDDGEVELPTHALEVYSEEKGTVVMLNERDRTKRSQHWQIRWLEDGGFQLRSRHSGYVLDVYQESTAPGATVIHWPFHGGSNQRWRIGLEVASFGKVALISARGTTVSAEPDGEIFTNRVTHIRGWEKFTIRRVDGPEEISYGDKVALQSHDGKYMSAQEDDTLLHNVTHIKSWEIFTVVPCAGETRSGPLFTGEPFALKSHRDNYVMAHNDGTVDARAVVQNHRTKWILAPTWNATVDIETVHPLDA